MAQTMRPPEGLFAGPRRIEALADLFANVWQFGYVTSDLDRAIEQMRERFGLEHCLKLPTGGATFLIGDQPAEWDARFAIRLHHLAMFIELGEDEWERTRSLLAQSGLRFDYTVLIPGRVRAGYVDTSA